MIARVDLHIGEDLARSQIAIDGVSCPCQEIKIDILNGRLPIVTLIGLAVEGQDIAGVASYEASPFVVHPEFPMEIAPDVHKEARNDIELLRRALNALKVARREHFSNDEDPWYSCPKSPEGTTNDSKGDGCDCGADRINDSIDPVISEIEKRLYNT